MNRMIPIAAALALAGCQTTTASYAPEPAEPRLSYSQMYCVGSALIVQMGAQAYRENWNAQETVNAATTMVLAEDLPLSAPDIKTALLVGGQLYKENGWYGESLGEVALDACLENGWAYR